MNNKLSELSTIPLKRTSLIYGADLTSSPSFGKTTPETILSVALPDRPDYVTVRALVNTVSAEGTPLVPTWSGPIMNTFTSAPDDAIITKDGISAAIAAASTTPPALPDATTTRALVNVIKGAGEPVEYTWSGPIESDTTTAPDDALITNIGIQAAIAASGGGSGGISIVDSGTTTIYISTSGNDITGDGSSGSPYATLPHALKVMAAYAFINGANGVIDLAAGTYDLGESLTLSHTTPGAVSIVGAGSSTILQVEDGIIVDGLSWGGISNCNISFDRYGIIVDNGGCLEIGSTVRLSITADSVALSAGLTIRNGSNVNLPNGLTITSTEGLSTLPETGISISGSSSCTALAGIVVRGEIGISVIGNSSYYNQSSADIYSSDICMHVRSSQCNMTYPQNLYATGGSANYGILAEEGSSVDVGDGSGTISHVEATGVFGTVLAIYSQSSVSMVARLDINTAGCDTGIHMKDNSRLLISGDYRTLGVLDLIGLRMQRSCKATLLGTANVVSSDGTTVLMEDNCELLLGPGDFTCTNAVTDGMSIQNNCKVTLLWESPEVHTITATNYGITAGAGCQIIYRDASVTFSVSQANLTSPDPSTGSTPIWGAGGGVIWAYT